jgi:hypothetical protein
MNINAKHIRLQFDALILAYHESSGWSLSRDGKMIVYAATWERTWDAMTTHERSRCISFANQLR